MAPMMLSPDDSSGSPSSPGASAAHTPRSTTQTPRQAEPIAICGIACRLPGDSSTPAEFWKLLSQGRSAACAVPNSRFNVDGFYHPKGMDRPGSMVTKGGYFLGDDIREFENSFFGINNLEATYMDPQQRKLLEVVFECLENAGVPLERASGSNTGCYVGNFTFDYMVMQTKESEYMNRYSATGLGTTILSNRISHVFNLLGPSLVLDTACSSSLYCLHVACAALENYECDSAIVAGANLIQSAEQHIATMKAGVLSPTSQCHTFDISADGYGRGEGIGALYVKRLSDALRDGDPIRSVIKSSAINANGKTTGISLPSADGQEAVIRKAMAKGGVDPQDITYIECHGTGTKVGDAIEVDALARVFDRTAQRPLMIGSVKTNVGHSEAASGIAGVVKATLSLEKGLIPPTAGLKNINPKLKVEERNFSIPTTLTPWPEDSQGPRRVGINSFGYGGANAHVILEEAPTSKATSIHDEARQLLVSQSSVVLPLSAATVASLEARIEDFSNFDFGNIDILDLAHTLGSRRSNLPVRGFLVAPRARDIAESFASSTLVTNNGPFDAGAAALRAFIFTGQGSQWAGMCRELFSEFSIFRHAISEMTAVLKSIPHGPSWTLQDVILDTADPQAINDPRISQPCCTAIQVALLQLLASWGIYPNVTAGHSSGEIAAAFAAGFLSAAESIVIAYYRGYCVAKNGQAGAMMAVGLPASAAEAEIMASGLSEQARVACVNSTEGVTMSGDAEAIDKLLESLQNKKIFARKLKTGGQAYHSHHMLAFGDEYEALLDRVLPTLDHSIRMPAGEVVMVSSVTGDIKASGFTARYWRQNLESQVLFADAIKRIHELGQYFFIELGPHSSLELPIKQTLASVGVPGSQVKYAAPIKRGINAVQTALNVPGALWLNGYPIDWSRVNGLQAGWKSSKGPWSVVTDLPRYRFDYDKTLWSESRQSLEYRQRKHLRHELLGSLVPGGSGNDYIFRNIIKPDDVCWIGDHRLEETIVFAGAGYLCMAMEALRQVTDTDISTEPSYRFSNVHIMNALVLSTDPSAQVEIFTSLHRSDITNVKTSSTWWEFTISTYQGTTAVTHTKGSISITPSKAPLESKYQAPEGVLEATAKRTWYKQFVRSGLNYGPRFQPISEYQTPRMKSSPYASAKTPLQTTNGDPLSVYPIHPITLDAMIQLCIVATANGVPKDLRAQVPTKFSSITVNSVVAGSEKDCRINAIAHKTGFESAEGAAEVVTQNGEVVAQFEGLRLAVYASGAQSWDEEKRHPILRTLWKPDVYGLGLISRDALEQYAQRFADEANSPVKDDGLLKLGAVLDLLVHKSPRCRILELGNSAHEFTLAVLDLFSSKDDFRKLVSYHTAAFQENGALTGGPVDLKTGQRAEDLTTLEPGTFDLVMIPGLSSWTKQQTDAVKEILAKNAVVVGLARDTSFDTIPANGFNCVSFPVSQGQATVFVAQQPGSPPAPPKNHRYVIVERKKTRLGSALADRLRPLQGYWVSRVNLRDLVSEHIPSGSTVFNLCEVETPLLATTTDDEMSGVKVMTDKAGTLIWVTGGNILHGDKPEFALAAGMSRAITLEQPALKFYTYDIDQSEENVQVTAERLVQTLSQQSRVPDREFVQRKGVVHVSRFIPDDGLNTKFRGKQGLEVQTMLLEEAEDVRLDIQRAGQFDTLFFRQTEPAPLNPTEVRLKVASVGLNAKDFYVLAGRVDTPKATCQLECAGTIVQVGSAVTEFAAGDRVVVMAPTHFQTYQTVPQWACQKLQDDESFDVAATLLLVYATAIYALRYRANVQKGESILVHSGAGGLGIAIIQLAKLAGAKVFATVSTEEKKSYLVDNHGVDPSCIFSSRDTSFLDGIMKATGGRGVDVIVNSLTGDQLHATWRCAAPFGRFVEVGKLDLSTAGRLDMDQFLKNTTFTSFDLSALYAEGLKDGGEAMRTIWGQLTSEVMSLYRQGKISAFEPLRVFDVSEAAQAFRHFSSRSRIGKIAINLEKAESTIAVQPLKNTTRLSGDKSYVMIGCLGGLGRTLSRWMLQRGARKFAFLGRTGTDKLAARNLIQDLEAHGAECVVVRGDVCNPKDVEAVVEAAEGEIGGVIQAAMGLNEAIFSMMPNKHWHTGIDPKVQGTWNLYNALRASGRDKNLDFFIMTSSVSGSVGTATESNYCAANHFLDAFARHLRSRPESPVPGAFALGLGMISEVGYLHDNPEIEALLLRKGIQAIDADELVQIVDLTLSSCSRLAPVTARRSAHHGEMGIHHAYDEFAASHVLTGMEAFGLKELRKKGFDGTNLAWDDPRAGLLANALDGDKGLGVQQQHEGNDRVPAEVVKLMQESQPPKSLDDALLDHIRGRFGNLILMKFEAVDTRKPLADYGMDSMIAAEFKTWFYQNMAVDIPLLTLLDKTSNLETLRGLALAKLQSTDDE
ncbi:reducing type I polyketide synthase 10 [Durotheca rogersii]|uniref:reducing type I polyketide synthase 10 n=1 Tax=Durotheca rogersii TaxID=419775 RepID=UPI002220DE7B|nr:reducing type I polyketide synthase 10 [Durotheca rogersii]KAI5866016.1 reducing type I polyketide synthase 10 [Durotheca rogersii]